MAAGASSRMGHNKLLVEFGGTPLVRRVVGVAARAGLDPVMAVLGHEAARVQEALEGMACEFVFNPAHDRGVNRSLLEGVAALPPRAQAVVVLLADMPLVRADMIETLVARYREGAAPLVVSDYEGVPAPPTLFDRTLFPELGRAEGEGCGREVVQRHRASADIVVWPRATLTDLDIPDDVARVKELMAADAL